MYYALKYGDNDYSVYGFTDDRDAVALTERLPRWVKARAARLGVSSEEVGARMNVPVLSDSRGCRYIPFVNVRKQATSTRRRTVSLVTGTANESGDKRIARFLNELEALNIPVKDFGGALYE